MNQVHTLLLCFSILFQSFMANSQSGPMSNEVTYYAVVGSFAVQSNALKFTKELSLEKMEAHILYNEKTKIYNVYHQLFNDRASADNAVRELRKDPKYFDAWVKRIPEEVAADSGAIIVDRFGHDSNVHSIGDSLLVPQSSDVDKSGMGLFVSLVDVSTENVIKGKVKIINPVNAQLLDVVTGNQNIPLSKYSNLTKIQLICDVFGYRKIQQEINLEDPRSDSAQNVEIKENQIAVNFELVRFQRGDIQALFNVYFYNDASIMMHESVYQLQELLAWMNRYPKSNIKLHGHSNGRYAGKVVVPKTATNFFSVAESSEIWGSAKLLSQKRAEMVRDYLIFNGVEAGRIQVKSWGGSRPLFDKHSKNAKKNLRVEVEITQE